jgi:tetratricopeptide (TPR) repeat protein
MGQVDVFISYAWQGESEKVAREVEARLKEKGLNIIRDQGYLGYKGSIKEFMQKIGKGKYVILVISDRYLKSENCMYELLQIAEDEKNFKQHIFPLVMQDAKISRAADRLDYVHYWEKEIDNLENKMKQGGLTHLQGIYEDLNLYDEIRRNISRLTDILKDINALNLQRHKESCYEDLYQAIVDRNEHDMEVPETSDKKPETPQIKILSITASPEGENYILYEQEQDTLLDAFKNFDREQVFLDMPDPVKSTLVEIKEHLEDGKHDILNITAHGGINGKGEGVLSLEDHQGNLDEVTGKELLEFLKLTPKIVILSACHSARKEPDLMPVARTLHEKGIETVIGMKKKVSHRAAIEFNVAFFNALCQKETVKQAFEKGKEAIFSGEQQRIKEIPGWDAVKEYEIPQLLTTDENLTVDHFSDFRIEAPGRPESHHFLGARYLERGFIGRRQVLRDIFKSIDNKEGAVVLKGPGGIGKSTLTTRTAANLRRKGYEFIVVQGDTTIEQILEKISKKATALEVKDAEKVFAANAEPNEKLGWYLDQFLLKQKVVLILDNFEENQDEEKGGAFKRERLKEFLWFFRDSLKHHDTFLMFSTRYALPGFDSPDITRNIPEFSPVEFRKMLLNSKALKSLDSRSVKTLMEEIGGNPRALDLLDSIAYEEFKQREFTWEQLKSLFPEMRERIIDKKGKGDEFTPLFLDRLFGYLSEPQRQLLDVLSIYRSPVPVETITVHNVSMARQDRRKLGDLSLLECIDVGDKNLYYVHRLTALYLLEQMKGAERKRCHKKAAGYFEALRDKEGKIFLDDLIEARWHYIQAGEWNKAAEITFSLEDYLSLRGYPQWAMELLQELEIKKLNDENKYITNGKLGSLYLHFGEYENALSYYNKSLEISEKKDDSIGIATNLHNIGAIYQDKGDYEAALTHYQKSKDIKEKIGDIKGVAYSLHQIGMIYQDKGDYEAALTHYQKSKDIKEKIGDIKGVSNSLHQIGRIYQYKGDYEAALTHYQKSIEIQEKIGYIAGTAISMGQMGKVLSIKGQHKNALKLCIQSYLIFVKLESPNAKIVKGFIKNIREKLPEEQFNAILKEFNLPLDAFDEIEAEE